jgi:1,4-alpha-glucan branching enzyme
MIESRVEDDGRVRVTFRLPNINRAQRISVVGEFNAWCPTANAMEVEGDELVTVIVLQPGRTYRFRYLLDDERWENDWAADNYVPNEFGGDDSVLDLTGATGTGKRIA